MLKTVGNIRRHIIPKRVIFFIPLAVVVIILFFIYLSTSFSFTIGFFTTAIALLLSLHGIFTLLGIIYAWDNENYYKKHQLPTQYRNPKLAFTALVPARHEERVIADTINAINRIKYPEHLKETLIICRRDDELTIRKAQETIQNINQPNIKLLIFDDLPINKPHALNIGLKEANGEMVVVFDAEDEPHENIYLIVNTLIRTKDIDVVQAGVQLMNFVSPWFATLNVLEYFFWFKSILPSFAEKGLVPLGGNTVFFKKEWLEKVNGWDERMLTEDADIGIRLSIVGAKTEVIYSEQHSTQEETPSTLTDFIRQRTRWNQGFMQILFKGDWLKLSGIKQKSICFYLLIWPQLQALLFLLLPISILTLSIKLPVGLALITSIPLYVLFIQLLIANVALYEFALSYRLSYPFWIPFQILLTFYPYFLVLGFSALRACYRLVKNIDGWEKTEHLNTHRKLPNYNASLESVNQYVYEK